MKHSEDVFEGLLKDNKHKIYRICRIYAVSPMEPQDLFQEVVFQLWKSLDSFKGHSSLDTWVYKITLNVCLRSKMKLEKVSARTTRFDAIEFAQATEQTDPLEQERFLYLKECISSLNDVDKSIVILYLDEVAYREIAMITGLSENHIAVKMKRIKKKLLQCMQAKLD